MRKWGEFGETTRLRLRADQRQWLEDHAPARDGLVGGVSAAIRDCVDLARQTEQLTERLRALAKGANECQT
jgi:hypothetical protein